jgi:hypothetical protein
LRVRLASLGGAALSAGRCGERSLLARLTDETELTVARSALPFENADALRHLALAHAATGDELGAERHRRRALSIATQHGYHELTLSCERTEVTRISAPPRPKPLHTENFDLVSGLVTFEPETSESAFVLTRSG